MQNYSLPSTKFALLAEDPAHGVADLAQRGICLDGVDDQRHEILAAGCPRLQRAQYLLNALVVPAQTQLCNPGRLASAGLRIDAQERRTLLLLDREAVNANHNRPLLLQRLLIRIRRLLDLSLHKTALDSVDAAAKLVDLANVLPRLRLHLVGQIHDII